METVVSQFGQKLRSDKENVGLFYFSGHGVQHNGENYLIPIGAMNSLDSPQQLHYRTVNAPARNEQWAGSTTTNAQWFPDCLCHRRQ